MLSRVALVVCLCNTAFAQNWNPRLAAEYLDHRQEEWFAWDVAKRPGGPCVSCHTGLTYLLARPALRRELGEADRTSYETGLIEALRARLEKKGPVSAMEPMASQAAGVEAVLSTLLLTNEQPERRELSIDSQKAFERMWLLQLKDGPAKGAWDWFDLDLDPWETPDSRFYGAAVAALAVGSAPPEYLDRQDVRQRVSELTAYLHREQSRQPLHNRLMLLWASTRLPEILTKPARKSILEEVWRTQQPDGGWTIEALGPWKKHEAAPPLTGSNAYASAFTTFVLKRSGVARSNPKLMRALAWLRSHQDPRAGYWAAESMNKRYKPDSMQVRFMRDAATGFAVLALLEADHR